MWLLFWLEKRFKPKTKKEMKEELEKKNKKRGSKPFFFELLSNHRDKVLQAIYKPFHGP